MSYRHVRTPSGTSSWVAQQVNLDGGPPTTVLVLPEHSDQGYYVIAEAPRLVRDASGRPNLNLSLILERQPDPTEPNIRPLIQRGILTLDVQTGADPAAIEKLNAHAEVPYRRLFAHQVTYRFLLDEESPATGEEPTDIDDGLNGETGDAAHDDDSSSTGSVAPPPGAPPGHTPRSDTDEPPVTPSRPTSVLAQAEGSGTEGRAGLSVSLDRPQALAVLGALEGIEAPMCMCATLQYRAASASRSVHLSGSWAAIYDFIEEQHAAGSPIEEAALHQLVPQMAAEGVIEIADSTGAAITLPADVLTRLFMRQSAVVLRREPSLTDEGYAYTLRARPHESFRLSYTEAYSGEAYATYEVCAPLTDLIGNVLDDRRWNDHVHLVAEDPSQPGRVGPVPRRVPARRALRAQRGGMAASDKVAVLGNSITSMSMATHPTTDSALILHSDPAHSTIISDSANNTISLSDDFRLELPGKDKPKSLPVVHQSDAPFWRDRVQKDLVWYAPEYELVMPDPSTPTSEKSPFYFTYERVGVTAEGEPALRGEVQFMLRPRMPAATQAALKQINRVRALSVVPTSQHLSLAIPFIDATDGSLKTHRFQATLISSDGTVAGRVTLLNDWVRLAYGALAVENFQSQPARVEVGYTFSGYVPTTKQDFQIAFGAKTFATPVVFSATEAATLREHTYLDASRLTYVQPKAEVRFRREDDAHDGQSGDGHVTSRRSESITATSGNATTVATDTLLTTTPATTVGRPVNASPARPDVLMGGPVFTTQPVTSPVATIPAKPLVTSDVATLLSKVEYTMRTQVRRQTRSAVVPCNQYGRSYQERRDGTLTAAGCQDALTLGETPYRLYEEMLDLRTTAYRVYRSLQQPGRFLVAPAQFCITRRAAGDDDEYRPLIFLNALLDPEVAANNRVELRATLQPDIEPFQQQELLARLRAHDPDPVLEYAPDIPIEATDFNWHLDAGIGAASQTDPLDVTGPYLSAYFQMDLASWQLMRSVIDNPGIRGSARFTLSDGTALDANLLIKLDHVRGPWATGPLAVVTEGSQVRITNHTERTIDVSRVVRYDVSGEADRVPVEESLAAHQSYAVDSDTARTPVYSYPPGDPVALEEIRSFVEDIYSNIIFINLLRFANHNLIRLDIDARIVGIEGLHRAQLTEEMPVADIPIVLPLTTYLEQRILEFRVTKLFSDREAEATAWMQWNLDITVPVSLTREIVGL